MSNNESPIFSKTYDLTLCLLSYCDKFPKHERFRLAKRIEDSLFVIHECLLKAGKNLDSNWQALALADIELDKLRFYLRLCTARSLISLSQFEHISRMIVEEGKLLGGWIKKVSLARTESDF